MTRRPPLTETTSHGTLPKVSRCHHGLPGPMSFPEFEAFRLQPALWLPAVRDIARTHGLPADAVPIAKGTNLIAFLGASLVLKVFPPMLRHQFESERLTLSTLSGRLGVPTPQVMAAGEQEGWTYLAFSRVAGRPGDEVWPMLTEDEKRALLFQIGQLIREVQAIPVGPLAALEPQWDRFVPAQIAGCEARHLRLGLPARYLGGLGEYLATAPTIVPTGLAPVILTGEYIPENLMLDRAGDGVSITGLIDFGDVMTGWGPYDLVGPSTFMCGGDPARVRALLRGYGYAESDLGPALSRQLMTLFLLHRFSEPARQIAVPDWQARAGTLHELEQLLWPLGA